MFQVLNKTIQDNASLLENACFVVMVVYFLGYDSYLLHNGYACHYVKIMNLLFCGVHMCQIEDQRNILVSLVIVTKIDEPKCVCVQGGYVMFLFCLLKFYINLLGHSTHLKV